MKLSHNKGAFVSLVNRVTVVVPEYFCQPCNPDPVYCNRCHRNSNASRKCRSCEITYCSDNCVDYDNSVLGHWIVCRCAGTASFFNMSDRHEGIYEIALKLIALIFCTALSCCTSMEEFECVVVERFNQVFLEFGKYCTESINGADDGDDQEINDCWALMHALLIQRISVGYPSKFNLLDDKTAIERRGCISRLVSLPITSRLCQLLSANLVQISIENPLAVWAREIVPNLPTFVDRFQANVKLLPQIRKLTINNKYVLQSCDPNLLSSSDKSTVERALTRLAQSTTLFLTSDSIANEIECNPFECTNQKYYCLLPIFGVLPTSCLANVQLEACRLTDGRVGCRLVALRDISQSEPLTVACARPFSSSLQHCKHHVANTHQEQSISVQEKHHCKMCVHLNETNTLCCCDCARCSFEYHQAAQHDKQHCHSLQPIVGIWTVPARTLQQIGNSYFQETNYRQACRVYRQVVTAVESHIQLLLPDMDLHAFDMSDITEAQSASHISLSFVSVTCADVLEDLWSLLGDAYHALGAALLDSGDWVAGHAVWQLGLCRLLAQGELRARHEFLDDQVSKLNSFQRFCWPDVIAAEHTPCLVEHCCVKQHKYIFATLNPVWSAKECGRVVQMAEEYAHQHGGWTTSRHYAVPTTDLPIHAIPAALALFNELMEEKLAVMLMHQFLCQSTRRVEGVAHDEEWHMTVHDAFIVKYHQSCEVNSDDNSNDSSRIATPPIPSAVAAASSQRYLPLHMDQSTHSFTVALNSTAAYRGGGAYFADLEDAVTADTGQVVSFKGDLVHGGEPIAQGTRYIIAAFMLLQRKKKSASAPETNGDSSGCKRLKFEHVFGNASQEANNSTFSFSFGVD